MRGLINRLAPVLHLTRITTAFGAVANSWFVVLWTRAHPEERARAAGVMIDRPAWIELAGAAACSTGLYAFAMALNDFLDARRDAALHPERPIPAGRLTRAHTLLLMALLLGVSLGGAALMGPTAVAMALLTAGAVGAFNAAAKFIPSAGFVLLSLIYAAQMMTPNFNLAFVWPVWVAMTHAMLVGAMAHRAGERRPRIARRTRVSALVGWVFWSGVLLWAGVRRAGWYPDWVGPAAGVLPAMLIVGFFLLGTRIMRSASPPAARRDAVQRAGALWLPLYGAAWMLGDGRWGEAAALGAVAAAGLLSMTVLREAFILAEAPLRYER